MQIYVFQFEVLTAYPDNQYQKVPLYQVSMHDIQNV